MPIATAVGMLLIFSALLVRPASGAEIVITNAGVTPRVVDAVTGERVTFVNRTDATVHVLFGEATPGHEVVQAPGEPLWVVFHRPGSHTFTVHVYSTAPPGAFPGVVEVTADAEHAWDRDSCGVRVRGNCLQP